jgi:hypothetical protein
LPASEAAANQVHFEHLRYESSEHCTFERAVARVTLVST